MIVIPYKTDPITVGMNLNQMLEGYLPVVGEKEIVVVTSKIVSICQGRVKKITTPDQKRALVKAESQRYIDNDLTRRYGFQLTICHDLLVPNAGIDESNGNGYEILWPENPMESARLIWDFMRTRFHCTQVGVIITDSHSTILRYGTTGIGLAWCGFEPLNSYIGKPDIFGRKFTIQQANVLDGLAASAVVTMGEGSEQTPIAVIKGAQNVIFTDTPPTKEDEERLHIPMEKDMYAPLLMNAPWQKGGKQ